MVIEYATTREAADPHCLRPGEAATLLAGHRWRRLAVVGDSVAAGVGDPVDGYAPMSWTDRIAAELRVHQPGLAYRNLGRRNRRAAQVRAQQLAGALAFAPDLAVVACGAADTMDAQFDGAAVEREIDAIVTALRTAGADVLTVEVMILATFPGLPEAERPRLAERLRRLNRHVGAVAAARGTVHVELAGHPASAEPGMHSGDGLHGNGRSHAISAAVAIRRLGAHLGNTYPG